MDILKAFNIAGYEANINIQGTIDDPLFQANQIGKLLNISNIHDTINAFDDEEKVLGTTDTPGGLQNVTFLTELGLYRLLGISRKPIAKQFQKWVCKVIKEIRQNGKYELQNTIEAEKKLHEIQLEIEKHKALMKSYANRRVVYFTKLKRVNDNQLILKLGWTNDIESRNRALNTQFGGSTFLDIFECHQNAEFELFLKRHPDMIRFFYKDEIIPNVHSTETYLISNEDYINIINRIVKKNVDMYAGFNPDQYVEMEKIKLENRKLAMQEQLLELANNGKITDQVINIFTESIKVPESDLSQSFVVQTQQAVSEEIERKRYTRTNVIQRRVQQYDPTTFKLIKTYDGLMDAIRTNPQLSKIGVKTAATKNTIYQGYRWYFIQPDQETKEYMIPETVPMQASSTPRFVALLDKEQETIINVFSSQAHASKELGIKRKQTINDCLHTGRLFKNAFHFRFFDEISDEIKSQYDKQLPNNTSSPFSTKIHQIDQNTKTILHTYDSIADVLKVFYMSRASLKRAIATQTPNQGYIWNEAD